MCLRVLKESNKSEVRELQSRVQCYYLSESSTFFPTTFLEIAVYNDIVEFLGLSIKPDSKSVK